MRMIAAHADKRAEFARVVGSRIREERTKKGLSRADVAVSLGFADSASVAGWEIGRAFPPSFLLGEIADLLGISLDYLILGKK